MGCVPRDTLLLIQVLDSSTRYSKFPIFSAEDLRSVLIKASRNRLLYAFSTRMIHNIPKGPRANALASIVLRGQTLISRYKVALYTISSLLSRARVPFLIIKTVKSQPYVPSDIDILIQPRDFYRALESLESCNNIMRSDEDLYGESKATLMFDHSVMNSTGRWAKKPWHRWDSYQGLKVNKVDVHTSLSWQGIVRVSPSFAWTSTRRVDLFGVRIPVPSIETELVCGIASMLFDHRCIRLIDFLTMKDNLTNYKVSFSRILSEARKHSWEIELSSFLDLANLLYHRVYRGHESVFDRRGWPLVDALYSTRHNMTKHIDFPFNLPSEMVLNSTLRCGGPISIRLLSLFAFLSDRLRSKVGVERADEFRWLSDREIFALNLQE